MSAVPTAPEPRTPRRFAGKPFAIGFGIFLVVGTIAFYWFARRAELARQQVMEHVDAQGETAPPR